MSVLGRCPPYREKNKIKMMTKTMIMTMIMMMMMMMIVIINNNYNDSRKRSPPVSDLNIFARWVVAYGRFNRNCKCFQL